MKKVIVLFVAILAFTANSFAQTATQIETQNESKTEKVKGHRGGKGKHADKMDMKKELNLTSDQSNSMKKIGNDYKGKMKALKTDETLSNNSIVKKINGDNTIDIYAKVAEDGKESTTLNVWFNLGGAYLSSQAHGDKAKEAQAMLSAFALSVSRTMVEDQLKEEQKKLKKEEGTLKDLEKDKKGLEKDIEDWKKKIAKAESDIKANEEKQKTQTTTIATQTDVVKEVTKKLDSLK